MCLKFSAVAAGSMASRYFCLADYHCGRLTDLVVIHVQHVLNPKP